jgi:hypothetical protein
VTTVAKDRNLFFVCGQCVQAPSDPGGAVAAATGVAGTVLMLAAGAVVLVWRWLS